jgi:hypothetical protein
MSAVVMPAVESPRELLGKLPPSERDFEVFACVVVDGGTTRLAATQFSISQTRVCQVLDRVRDWLGEVLPAAPEKEATPQQLDLARRLAADRLDHLYGQALVGWRSSEGEVERIRVTPDGYAIKTRTHSHGDPRYLSAASRVALIRSKVGSEGVFVAAVAKAADAREALGIDMESDESDATTLANHPAGDCSENGAIRTADAIETRQPVVANPVVTRSSSKANRRAMAARDSFFGPVQRPVLSDLAAGVVSGRDSLPARGRAELGSPALRPGIAQMESVKLRTS